MNMFEINMKQLYLLTTNNYKTIKKLVNKQIYIYIYQIVYYFSIINMHKYIIFMQNKKAENTAFYQ